MSQNKTKKKLATAPGYVANNDILLASLPLLVMAVYMYGIRSLIMVCVALVTAVLCDVIACKMIGSQYNSTENSSLVIAMILTLLMPANIEYYIIVVAVAVAVLMGKYVFGGVGNYPFNPAALGFVVAIVSWPDKIFAYPTPFTMVGLGATDPLNIATSPSSTLALGGLPNISTINLFLGNYAGGIGCTATLVIISCFVLLYIRKRLSFLVPCTFLMTCAAISFIFPRIQASRLEVMKYELLSCSLVYGAVFLLSDITTLPQKKTSRMVYGVVLGIATMLFRYFGSFEMGMCFAILAVNSVSGYIDRMVEKIRTKIVMRKMNKKAVEQP